MTATGYTDPYDDGYPEEEDPRLIGDEWKRAPEQEKAPRPTTSDGLPIPADVLQWFALALRRWIVTELFDGDGEWTPKFERWYGARVSDYLIYERFGEGFSMWGGWRLDEPAMWASVERADADNGYTTRPTAPESPPAVKAPVEPATEADVDAALARLDHGSAPEEKRAGSFWIFDRHDRWHEWRARYRRIKAKTPVTCRCCGAYFAPGPQDSVSCPNCRAAGRRRCIHCDEVFVVPPEKKKVKRCEPCLAREAEYKATRKRPH